MEPKCYVYIMSNQTGSVFQVGRTPFLKQEVQGYRENQIAGFPANFQIHRLVYVEECNSTTEAIEREKQIKNLRRFRKIKLIEQQNPHWEDLSNTFEF